MKVDLTNNDLTTIMAALDNYRHWNETTFSLDPKSIEVEQEAASAEKCWQKLMAILCLQSNNQTSASVDPFSLPTEEK